MAQPGDVAALLEGPKERRAEFAVTRKMDEAVEAYKYRRGITRSQAFRALLAQGIAASRTRDASEQATHRE